ncbi:hyaluronidase-1-like [Orbicella faveolata]|uniref:hyaluronidase-1-like n=1 Tax=Orbicella faveolata TaxID=48498 RepID=UPI0009E615DB|nr:hyaluronidase-1-like [Orbicella faveolata]
MKGFLSVVALFLTALPCACSRVEGPPLPNRPFIIVWNTPTDRCKSNWNVTLDFSAFDFVVNPDQTWRGEYIVIFYNKQLGLFPYFDNDGKAVNGGLPQLVNLTEHFTKVEEDITSVIPDTDFQGIGVIDWEYWKPVFDRNWDTLSIYRKKSMDLVRRRHPFWSDSLIEEIARLEYETAAQQLMEGTVLLVQKLRPKSSWGFYGFPNCYNNKDTAPYNCSKLTIQQNDQISWMFESSSALFPSIYLHDARHQNSSLFVKYRLLESFRRAKQLDGHSIPVYPYVRITYAVSKIYLNEADVMATVAQSAEQGTAGIVIWGDHLTEKTKTDCLEIKSYIDNFLGPLVKNLTAITQTCSQKFCNSHGRCTFELNPSVYAKALSQGVVQDLTDQWKFVSCKCYNGWSGEDCSHQV